MEIWRKEGGAVGILGRNEKVANKRADAINQKGGRAIALNADVMDTSQLISAREKLLREYGQINGLVNAVGGIQPQGVLQPSDDIFQMNMQGMKEVMDLNLWGILYSTQILGEAITDCRKRGYR